MTEEILDTNLSNEELRITPEIQEFLKETAKWGKFLGIVGFVMVGIFVLLGIFMAFFMGSMMADMGEAGAFGGAMGGALGFVYVILGLMYLFPSLYLYRFSKKMKIALDQHDQQYLYDSFQNLKSLYKFMGIFMAVILGIYALGLVFGILGGIASVF